jgi:hypothetical protein
MGFFSDMGFLEKMAFVICSPIIMPIAVASEVYDSVTRDDEPSTTQKAAEEQARLQAKERVATKEREDIVAFANERLLELQNAYRPPLDVERAPVSAAGNIGGFLGVLSAVLSACTQLSFPGLRNALNSASPAAEIVDGLLPPLVENVEIKALSKEIIEMQELCLVFQNLEQMV